MGSAKKKNKHTVIDPSDGDKVCRLEYQWRFIQMGNSMG